MQTPAKTSFRIGQLDYWRRRHHWLSRCEGKLSFRFEARSEMFDDSIASGWSIKIAAKQLHLHIVQASQAFGWRTDGGCSARSIDDSALLCYSSFVQLFGVALMENFNDDYDCSFYTERSAKPSSAVSRWCFWKRCTTPLKKAVPRFPRRLQTKTNGRQV